MKDIVKNISDQTVGDILKEDIVLPSFYAEKFKNNAERLGIEVDTNRLINQTINLKLNQAEKMINHANEHLDELNRQASDAQEAIKARDSERLEEIHYNVDSIKKEIYSLKKQLYTDTLTKIKNRRWINEEYIDDKNQLKYDGNLIFIDLNDFKFINDTYGHVVGDKVLIFIASFLKQSLDEEKYDIARYAGDEFIVFSKNTSFLECVKTFNQLQKNIFRKKLIVQNEDKITITFSYGIESFKQNDDFKRIIGLADKKMYNNKKDYKEKLKKGNA